MSAQQKSGMAIVSLVLGIVGIPTAGICGLGGIVGLILGIVAVSRAGKFPREYGGKGLAVGGIITNALSLLFLPIIAAIAIPSLLRARVSANEAGTIGDLRSILSAEAAYSASNGGYYDTLECLATPQNCIPNYPAAAPNFLTPDLLAPVKSGYRRTFHPGVPAGGSPEGVAVSPSSLQSFAYVAVPVNPNQTGVRGFCGDDRGIICFTADGSAPAIENGQCSPTCPWLQ